MIVAVEYHRIGNIDALIHKKKYKPSDNVNYSAIWCTMIQTDIWPAPTKKITFKNMNIQWFHFLYKVDQKLKDHSWIQRSATASFATRLMEFSLHLLSSSFGSQARVCFSLFNNFPPFRTSNNLLPSSNSYLLQIFFLVFFSFFFS